MKRVELLYVTDMENPVSGLWLEVFVCVLYTTLSSHTDTAPISTIYFESMWAVFYLMGTVTYKKIFGRHCLFGKEGFLDEMSAWEVSCRTYVLEQLWILHPVH